MTIFIKNIKIFSIIAISFFLISTVSCAYDEVIKYRTETVPVRVKKYRTEYKNVETEKKVPYKKEIKVKKYKVVKKPYNNTDKRINLVVLPFTFIPLSLKNQFSDTDFERLIISNSEYYNKYKIIPINKLENHLNKKINNFNVNDFKKVANIFNIKNFISGLIKKISDNYYKFIIEIINAKTLKNDLKKIYKVNKNNIPKKYKEIFYGKKVFDGYKIDYITEYKTERVTELKEVQVPYYVTEYQEKEVSYKEEEINWVKTIIGYLAFVGAYLIAIIYDKKDDDL